MRGHPPILALALSMVLVAAGTAAITGCGTPTASPEHLGTWLGYNDTVAVTITVAGTPGHYTATLKTANPPGWGYDSQATFRGGETDDAGYVVFDTTTLEPEGVYNTALDLTLGPVSGDTMTATFTSFDETNEVVEVRRE